MSRYVFAFSLSFHSPSFSSRKRRADAPLSSLFLSVHFPTRRVSSSPRPGTVSSSSGTKPALETGGTRREGEKKGEEGERRRTVVGSRVDICNSPCPLLVLAPKSPKKEEDVWESEVAFLLVTRCFLNRSRGLTETLQSLLRPSQAPPATLPRPRTLRPPPLLLITSKR